MTLSAPIHLNPPSGFRPADFIHRKPAPWLAVPAGTVIPFPSTESAHRQHILMVEFTSPDGRIWQAIGGGDTLADAIAFARESCPNDATWQAIGWNDSYGD